MCAFIDRAKCPGLFACGLRHRPPTTGRCNLMPDTTVNRCQDWQQPNPLIEIHK
jgi:hypothetical protein